MLPMPCWQGALQWLTSQGNAVGPHTDTDQPRARHATECPPPQVHHSQRGMQQHLIASLYR